MTYSEISLEDAWSMLTDDANAVLVDVRTIAEWNFVGMADLSSIGKEVMAVEWNRFPDGSPNPEFVEQAGGPLSPEQPVLIICRSGARSRAAAQALAGAGFSRLYNVTTGFEGDLNADGHRHGGWKDHLPWRQS
jgi:rhodanese-related sulfurtransferase